MTSNSGGEGDIRKDLIEAGLIDCMVALPSQLFYNTMIPACLWFLARDRSNHKFRDRRNEILFIDARKMGSMISRRHRELAEADILKISSTYHAWRTPSGIFEAVKGFCHAATLDEVRANNYVLTPGRYVGAEEVEDDGIPFEDKMRELTGTLAEQFAESARLETLIKEKLKEVGYEW